ncbi:uncharacterized protein LOC134215457 [Armigeres subalbatus]|uniref:uncharacterized protein LOC134215457 n=1 Tax=Armigeres subalbatus TaxID=124917 RepID=UPI002ED3D5B4
MWPTLSRCRTLFSPPLLSSLTSTFRFTSSCFHVLAGYRVMESPLANQSSKQLPLDRSANQLLASAVSPLLNQVCGFKVKGHLKRRCKDCFFVVRHQRLYVLCKTHPRHKQMSMKKHERNTWILTDATQSPKRAW